MSYQQKIITGLTPFPNKPAFLVKVGSTQSNVTGAGTTFPIPFDTAIINQTSSFDTGTGVFTSPVSGSYIMGASVDMRDLGAANTEGQIVLVTTARSYNMSRGNYGSMRGLSNNLLEIGNSTLADMSAGDVASVTLTVSNGAGDTVDVFGQGGTPFHTWFWGYFIG